MPEDEVGQLTFLEYDALLRRKHLADDKLRLNAGYIYAAIYNTAMGDPDRTAVQPSDIVSGMQAPKGPLPDFNAAAGLSIFRAFMPAIKKEPLRKENA